MACGVLRRLRLYNSPNHNCTTVRYD